eukprot:jgi/Bigna1/129768/aug1.9_g4476
MNDQNAKSHSSAAGQLLPLNAEWDLVIDIFGDSLLQGFGAADDDQDEHSRNVRTMTTGELRAEIESFGLGSEDCEDRLDLERKLKAVRRGTYKEGKIKTAEDAGGYLKSQRTSSSGPAIEDISGISSQENKAAAFDQALQQTSVQSQQAQAESFDAAIQDRLDSVTSISSMAKKGQKVFDLLEYPCEHEIKIVGAKASEIEMRVRSIVGDTTGTDPEVLKTSSREKGKWISISVMAPVSSSEMLYDIYARLNSEERFRYVM